MEIQRQLSNPAYPSSRLRIAVSIASLVAGVVVGAILCSGEDYRDAAVMTALSLGVAIVFSGPVTIDRLLLTWFATTPLASFYLRYPLDRSIVTYDRLVFFLITLLILLATRSIFVVRSFSQSRTNDNVEFSLTKFELVWSLLSVVALASVIMHSNNVPSAA